jgi:hypothetical protein
MDSIKISFYDSFQAIVDMMAAAEQKGVSDGDIMKVVINHSTEMADDFHLLPEKAAKLQNLFTELHMLTQSLNNGN